MPNEKFYILTRRDLSPAAQTVQTSHAMAEFMGRFSCDPQVKDWLWNHKTLIILGIENEAELIQWESKLLELGIPCHVFVEPDMDNQKTSLAIHPMADPSLFKRLKLL